MQRRVTRDNVFHDGETEARLGSMGSSGRRRGNRDASEVLQTQVSLTTNADDTIIALLLRRFYGSKHSLMIFLKSEKRYGLAGASDRAPAISGWKRSKQADRMKRQGPGHEDIKFEGPGLCRSRDERTTHLSARREPSRS
jgi:hypothetical protein